MSNITTILSSDIIHQICYFLTKKELYSLFLTTKKFKYLKKLIIGTTLMLYEKYQIFRKCKICKHDDYKHIRRILYKNKPMYKGFLPDNIEYIKCIYGFNQPINPGVLPAQLIHLDLGFFFNQPLDIGVLPPFLVYLNLGFVFNHALQPKVLPSSLQHIVFGKYFNKKIDKYVLPSGLKIIGIYRRNKHNFLPDCLPEDCIIEYY